MSLSSTIDSSVITNIAFWVVSISVIVSSFAVVQIRDLFRAALFLILAFVGIAGMFILLRAEFLAVVQILIYVGAISVLIIFAILLTRDVQRGSPAHGLQIPAALLASLLFASIAFVILKTEWNLLDEMVDGGKLSTKMTEIVGMAYADSVPRIAELLLSDFVLAFEAASVLLLAVVIGSLVLIRGR